ncbi:MAG: hypothetical protein HXX81_03660, partial [Campylobacterales bacterium]|nr:hypothetical protein [Campylobacterales bacterium]
MQLAKYSLLLVPFLLIANSDIEILSKNSQDILNTQKEINKLESDKLYLDWVNKINLNYNKSFNEQFDPTQESQTFSVEINQPIFKSGGIYFATIYSSVSKDYNDLAIKLKEKELIKNALISIANLKKIDLEIEKSKLLLANAKI